MKKILVLAMTCLMAASLVGCASKSSSDFVDGTYSAKISTDNYGWTDTLEVTYKDGAVTSAVFESVDFDGNKKSEATAEEYPMDPVASEWIPTLSANITSAGNADFDAVTGATLATNNAKVMMEAIEAAAKEGNSSETLVVDAPAAE